MAKRVIRRTKTDRQRGEFAEGNLPIVSIIEIVCDHKHWEQDMFCPKCKEYHTKHYKDSESEPTPIPTGQPARDSLQFSYSGAPEKYTDRVSVPRYTRKTWH